MADKKNSEKTAYLLYVEQGYNHKEIAQKLGVNERTVGRWVEKNNWKSARDAYVNAPTKQIGNIKEVISDLTEQTLELQKERRACIANSDKARVKEINMELVGLADQISKWNKSLTVMDKDNRITLNVYMDVMEDVFKCMHASNPDLHFKTLDFQESHVRYITQKLG